MPGSLLYFCAEWRQARRVLQLDRLEAEALGELCACALSGETIPLGSGLATRYGLGGWRPDAQEAKGVAPLAKYAAEGLPVAGSLSAVASIKSLFSSPSGQSLKSFALPAPSFAGGGPAGGAGGGNGEGGEMLLKPNSSCASLGGAAAKPFGKARRKLLQGAAEAFEGLTLLVRNPAHPLSELKEEYSKEAFLLEMKKRLTADRLFTGAGQTSPTPSSKEPEAPALLGPEATADLFEALVLMQCIDGGSVGATLRFGRAMDSAVERFYTMVQLRRHMVRSAAGLSAYVSSIDVDKGIDFSELKRHLSSSAPGGGGGGVLATLTAEGAKFAQVAEAFMSVLDSSKKKMERPDLQRQIAIAAPPKLFLVELVSRLELKHGPGKLGLSEAACSAPLQLFDHLSCTEGLDMCAEDVVRFHRLLSAGSNSSSISSASMEASMRQVPLELSWGFEPLIASLAFAALGARLLMLERSRKQDASLPPEAIALVSDPCPEEATLRERFNSLWDKCWPGGRGGSGAVAAGPAAGSATDKNLRGCCLRLYVQAARAAHRGAHSDAAAQARLAPVAPPDKPRRKLRGAAAAVTAAAAAATSGTAAPAPLLAPLRLVRALFPNVCDVMAVPSTRMYVGQAFLIRYRVQGKSSFLPAPHEVLKNEREKMEWPATKKVLGETPFIGLVPRGLTWSSGGGGGFYLGSTAFAQVATNMRVDLPKDPATGAASPFGCVELTAPASLRSSPLQSDPAAAASEYELRLFCSTHKKVIGCIGDPLPVEVVHQVRPPPVESLQVSCDGRSAALRWSPLHVVGPRPWQPEHAAVETVRLHMHSEKGDRDEALDPDATEWEVHDLAPDTEYEFRVRLENVAGPGREAIAKCKTNARCDEPRGLACAVAGTAHIDLKWSRPQRIGNESTKDQFQRKRESILCYEASLLVAEEDEAGADAAASAKMGGRSPKAGGHGAGVEEGEPAPAPARSCRWEQGSWRDEADGSFVARLDCLRPDTHYILENFCARTSIGPGAAARRLAFWTVPQVPKVATIRVRQGCVLIGLSHTGGMGVQEYDIFVAVEGHEKDEKRCASFKLPRSNLSKNSDATGGVHELSLPFTSIPVAETGELHTYELKASNAGGWSERSKPVQSFAAARQQGSEFAQAALIRAIEARRIELLEQTLDEVRDIEFSDTRYVDEASALLERLLHARRLLDEAVEARDPRLLARALECAEDARLPSVALEEELLRTLEAVVSRLDSAPGIEELRLALEAGREAMLPTALIASYEERLRLREEAQRGLEEGIEAARVPVLVVALEMATGMSLPSEDAARRRLDAVRESETLLLEALRTEAIGALVEALDSASVSGLREEELISKARTRLQELQKRQAEAKTILQASMDYRDPDRLDESLEAAKKAQVPEGYLREAAALLSTLQSLMQAVDKAEGIEDRTLALAAAREAKMPEELLEEGTTQLARLEEVAQALDDGAVEPLRRALRKAETCGVKRVEIADARETLTMWQSAMHDIDVASALARSDRLQRSLEQAQDMGIAEVEFSEASRQLKTMVNRSASEVALNAAVASCDLDVLKRVLDEACEADVTNTELVEQAAGLVIRLQQFRHEVQNAMASPELQLLHRTLGRVTVQPGLPSGEVAPLAQALLKVQGREESEIRQGITQAEVHCDFRMMDAVIARAFRASRAGVTVNHQQLEEAAANSKGWQEELRAEYEQERVDAQQRRLHRDEELAERSQRSTLPPKPPSRTRVLDLGRLENDGDGSDSDEGRNSMPRKSVAKADSEEVRPQVRVEAMRPRHSSRKFDFSSAAQLSLQRAHTFGRLIEDMGSKITGGEQRENSKSRDSSPTMRQMSSSSSEGELQPAERLRLPSAAVLGKLDLHYKPAGQLLFRLPREIVEGTLLVICEQEDLSVLDTPQQSIRKGETMCRELIEGVRALLDPEDDIRQVGSAPIIRDGGSGQQRRRCSIGIVDARLELGIAILVRAPNTGTEIADALCVRGDFSGESQPPSSSGPKKVVQRSRTCSVHFSSNTDLRDSRGRAGKSADDGAGSGGGAGAGGAGGSDAGNKRSSVSSNASAPAADKVTKKASLTGILSSRRKSSAAESIAAMFSHGLQRSSQLSSSRTTKLGDHARNVRSRTLRSLSVELSWTYPKGIMDTLDASCLLFSKEQLVDVVDQKGFHGMRYNPGDTAQEQLSPGSPIAVASPRGQPKSPAGDRVNGAVRYAGDHLDSVQRRGKQTINLRLDLLPRRISDIFFAVSANHGRDLAKFATITVTLRDLEGGGEPFASFEVPGASGSEACVMCSIYRASKGARLWYSNKIGSFCSGTSRDYKPVLAQVNKLGCPRNVVMREQVAVLLESIRSNLKLEQPVKSTAIAVDQRSSLSLRYAIELFGPSETDAEVEQVLNVLNGDDFPKRLASALVESTDGRLNHRELRMKQAQSKNLLNLALELSWEFPGLTGGGRPRADDAAAMLSIGGACTKEATLSSTRSGSFGLRDAPVTSRALGRANAHAQAMRRSMSKADDVRVTFKSEGSSGLKEALSRTDSRAMCSNILDASCFLFSGQGLREVVDYRGPHGVRLVSSGVLDYSGVWLGPTGLGDATGGAVAHTGEIMDDSACKGSQRIEVRLDQLPSSASELFFLMSSASTYDVTDHGKVQVMIKDAENDGHEIASFAPRFKTESQAAVMCCVTKEKAADSAGAWALEFYGRSCDGSAKDYRPAVRCLRTIQERRSEEPPPWPHSSSRKPPGPLPAVELEKEGAAEEIDELRQGFSAGRLPRLPLVPLSARLPFRRGGSMSSTNSMDSQVFEESRQQSSSAAHSASFGPSYGGGSVWTKGSTLGGSMFGGKSSSGIFLPPVKGGGSLSARGLSQASQDRISGSNLLKRS